MTRSQILIEDLVELINEHGGMGSFSQAMSLLMDNAIRLTLKIQIAVDAI